MTVSTAHEPIGTIPNERPVTRWRLDNPKFLLHLSLILVCLAFIRLIPGGDALSGGFTPSRLYETLLIVLGFALMPVFLLSRGHSLTTRLHSHWPMLLYCAWALLSFIWSVSPAMTLSKAIQMAVIVAGTLLFSDAYRRYYNTEHNFADILAIVLLSLVIIALIANLVIWGHPLAMKSGLSLTGEVTRPRIRIAYGHPGVMADLAALGLISLYASRLHRNVKWVSVPLLLYVGWLSDARSSVPALAFAMLSMILINRGRKAFLIASYVVACLVFAYFFAVNSSARPDDILGPVRPLFPEDLDTLNGRTLVWSVAWEHIQESPILGVGYYGSRFVILPVIEWAGDTHNNWIEVLLMTGAVGLVLLILFLIDSFSTAFRARDSLLLGVLVYTTCYTLTGIPFFVPELNMVIVLLCVNQARSRMLQSRASTGAYDLPLRTPLAESRKQKRYASYARS